MITKSKKIEEQRKVKRTLFTNKALDTHGITISPGKAIAPTTARAVKLKTLIMVFIVDCDCVIVKFYY